eukprot:TRINITY_DN12916_c0_g1_i1.p1 TRINITY_DN12916_c0_g1~~TRINITY_DN12916_c0_g1_i1.p1  ORF type:complete len:149 (-),score=31.72 TRINITY_DN12916_c0_g1_i1:9-455(-)
MHKSPQTVADIMSDKVVTTTPDTTLDKALQIMLLNEVGRLPVVDTSGKVAGIITDRDLRLAVDSQFQSVNVKEKIKHLADHKVADIMKPGVVTVKSNDSILTAAKLMRVSKVGGLPVLDSEKDIVIGIVTRGDMLDEVIRLLEPVPPT